MKQFLYLANTPIINSSRGCQPFSYLVHGGARGGIIISHDLLFLTCDGQQPQELQKVVFCFSDQTIKQTKGFNGKVCKGYFNDLDKEK